MLSDIEIAQNSSMKPIDEISSFIGVNPEEVEFYGKYKAKISLDIFKRLENQKDGKLILVTAINPTPAGEGKTTTTIGLGQAMNSIGHNTIIALREPSLGPVMGIKGGAAGGGYSQVVPMEDINLHFTGDIHAVTTANNLLSAIIDNSLHHGNLLNIDPRQIHWKRAIDMNDRSLRDVIVGLGGKPNGVPREDAFIISVASEVMAVLCLSKDLMDLKTRLGRMVVAYTYDGNPVTASDLHAEGAMAVLLKDALKPNIVQTLENNPVLIHGGPFANIAHGCNSVIATSLALKLADFCITEAGFGADLGAEKFIDIKCRAANLKPSAVVLVATVRALKYNGNAKKENLSQEDILSLEKGLPNLLKHIENIKKFNLPVVVSLNKFASDTYKEIEIVKKACEDSGVDFALCESFEKGGAGGVELANKVCSLICKNSNQENEFKFLYDSALPTKQKIEIIAKEIYGANGVSYSPKASKEIEKIKKMGYESLPVCIAKTQYSLSDDPKLLGRPVDFTISVKEVRLSAGAGFIVAITGDIMTLPGLPQTPSAQNIDIDEKGKITGLF